MAVLDGTVMLNAVGIMVGAGGNAGAEVSSSNKLCRHILLVRIAAHVEHESLPGLFCKFSLVTCSDQAAVLSLWRLDHGRRLKMS